MSPGLPGFVRRWRHPRPSLGPTGGAAEGAALDEEFLRRLERLVLLARRPATGGIGGEHRSAARSASTDFADYRPYMPGDDFRQIDWNAYGRLGQLYVKLTEGREQLQVQILLDASSSMDWGRPSKLWYARRLAAALAYLALARFDRVGLTTLGEEPRTFRPARGRARFPDALRFLDATRASGAVRLDGALAAYGAGRRQRGEVLLISDMLAPDGYQDGLDRLLRSGLEVVLLHVLSPQELDPESGGNLELVDMETTEVVRVSLTTETLARYRERLDRWCEEVESFCARRGIRYCLASTSTPFEDLLLDSLRRNLVLR